MASRRVYEKRTKPVEVDVPDWVLAEELVQLLEAASKGYEGGLAFEAEDDRGSVHAADLAALRSEVDAQPEAPHTINISWHAAGASRGYLRGSMSSRYSWQNHVSALHEDERVVDHVIARGREVFDRAANRRKERRARTRTPAAPTADPAVALTPAAPSRMQAILNNPWVYGIGSAVIAGVVLWLVLGH